MPTMSWPIWYRLDHMHIKAGLGHAMLATKMPTGSLTKMINRVDNGRGLVVRPRDRVGEMLFVNRRTLCCLSCSTCPRIYLASIVLS
jgi:hypothetical protein